MPWTRRRTDRVEAWDGVGGRAIGGQLGTCRVACGVGRGCCTGRLEDRQEVEGGSIVMVLGTSVESRVLGVVRRWTGCLAFR